MAPPENLPATQAEHTDDPTVSVNLPARHSTHVATDEAPVVDECLPAAQLLAHVEAPDAPEYLPVAHIKQVIEPALEYLPGVQTEHVSESALECVPATQVAHVLALALERFPAAHVKQVVEPGLAYFPAMHTAQKSGDDAQRELEDLPAGQSVQTEAPAVAAYFPASQGRQLSKEVA